MDYINIEIHEKATQTLKDMLKLKGDNMSLYTLKLIETQEKQLRIGSVSQQRELLLAYEKYTSQQVIGKENSRMAKSLVDGFLANNCG